MIPLLQQEAMFLGFESFSTEEDLGDKDNCRLALRAYAGGINTISGRNVAEKSTADQDYYVVPHQHRVDGFGGANGRVKQFVAVPVGSKYSVESQLLGIETGGIQFQIAPRLKRCV